MSEEKLDRIEMNDAYDAVEPAESARLELKRAYIQLGFGQFDKALASCRAAASLASEHYLPETLRAAILSASGAHKDALRILRDVIKRYPEQPLPRLYFAEACFLLGRVRQGRRALDDAGGCAMTPDETELFEHLDNVWKTLDPAEIPPPLEPTR